MARLLLGGDASRADTLRLPAPGRGCELHVERSDLAEGVYSNIPGWKVAHVGGDPGKALRR